MEPTAARYGGGAAPEQPPLNLVAKLHVGGSNNTRASGAHGIALGYQAPGQSTWNNTDLSKNHPSPWFTWPWQTLWSKQRVAPRQRALFISVFVPYRASDAGSARAIYEGISIMTSADGERATVTLTPPPCTEPLVVSLDVHGNWSVVPQK